MSIVVQNITKTFGSSTVLWDVSLTVPTGALMVLLGPSGSGKTTLLRIIAGLEQPDAGSGAMRFHNEDVGARDVEMDDAPAFMSQQDEHEEHAALDGRHGKKVARHGVFHMVAQERFPRLFVDRDLVA
jgi:ABC-type multidrug transport system ATPase subunit